MPYTDLQVSLHSWSAHLVTLRVTNPTSSPVTARARITVTVAGGVSRVLTSDNFTVAANGYLDVNIPSPEGIVSTTDEMDPIPPL